MQILYNTDTESITIMSRGPGCSVEEVAIEADFEVGKEFSFDLMVKDGKMNIIFFSNGGEYLGGAFVGDFNFLSTEGDGDDVG